jgi:hypothetical protein
MSGIGATVCSALQLASSGGPQRKLRTIDVCDRVQHLDWLKVGDQVIVRHTEALAIAVAK